MPADLSIVQNYDASAGAGTWANATHAAIVDVGIAAGSVCILRYAVENCGVMINPLIVDDHVHGSAVQGSGGARRCRRQRRSSHQRTCMLPVATDATSWGRSCRHCPSECIPL